ncbi:glycosyltransferase family 2 protein [Chitinophaga filiformis]|uniref:Glycosyltransferase, catalytic subunit of cellulose synthase and poly-beta-1,6-N-acetylglucosamine synthase n=1 Tax=Chitinophaga filiformis TaxID=104663 RepID=A0A1G8B6M8_CHIFI|nr:glycosyltransferase family 2 protein [Chitinophaga filiformis]SDH28663.1 Glycosyltransferase, catalytic subunit of cellulose synthase and poly-beta-1,6-N-acetylglucosamine synthase [Chitinophaga filiformis]
MQLFRNVFEGFVFVYGSTMLFMYALLAILSLRGIIKFQRKNSYVDYTKMLQSPIAPGISIIAPAFNEGVTIIQNVRSLLTLNYPRFEVIIVNDGSTDDTLEKLINEFQLQVVDFAYNERIKSQPVKRLFKSSNSAYEKLVVIDKVNGKSKADASNAGINAAAYDYFLCTDVDCIIEKDTLLRMIKPFMDEEHNRIKEVGEPCPECGYVHIVEDSTRVIATGATLRLANSCEVDEGVITRVRPPEKWLPRFQEMEYLRAYVLGKMGWSVINCVPNVSGGLGLFDKEIAIKAGGYDSKSFAEDMDIVTRMCTYMIDNKLKYAIRYIPTTQCWTEGPPTMKVFSRQRTRWGRGLAEIITIHRKVIFNPHYKRLGMIVLPYNLLFEFLAPIIEITGVFYYIYQIVTGSINWQNALILLAFVYFYSVMITTLAILWDQITYKHYKTWKEVIGLALMAFLEPFVYHPLIVFFALRGYFHFITGRKHSWGNMQRQGFGQRKPANT